MPLYLIICRLLVFISLYLAVATAVAATNPQEKPLKQPNRFDVISGVDDPGIEPHFESDLLSPLRYNTARKRRSAQGFDYKIVVSPEVQYSLANNEYHANSEQDFIFQWRFREDANSQSSLLFWGLNILQFGGVTPGELAASNGLSLETIGGAGTDVLWMLGDFHYEYTRTDNGFSMRAGHLFTNMKFAENKYMVDDRETFINGVVNAPSGVQWTSQKSLGVYAEYKWDRVYTIAGFQDKKSDPRYPNFDSLFDGKFHYIGELGYATDPTRVSLTLNYSSPVEEEEIGYGMVINGFHDFNDSWAIYGRFGRSWGQTGDLQYALAAGVAYNQPFGWRSDRIALAYIQAKPVDSRLSKLDRGLNFYWKWQLTDSTDLTFDLQHYFEHSKPVEGDHSQVTLIASRIRLVF